MLNRQNRFSRNSLDKRSLSEGSKPKTNHNNFLKSLYSLGLPEHVIKHSSDNNQRSKSLPSRLELPEVRLVEKVKSIANLIRSDYTTLEDISKYVYNDKRHNTRLKSLIREEFKNIDNNILHDLNTISKQNLIIQEKYGNMYNKQFFNNIARYIELSEQLHDIKIKIIKDICHVNDIEYKNDLKKLHHSILLYSKRYQEYKKSRRPVGSAFDDLAAKYNQERQSLENIENPNHRSQRAIAIDRAYFKIADRLSEIREKHRKRDKILQKWKEDLLKRAEDLLKKKQDCQRWKARLNECGDIITRATYSL